jgi:hypothetical protein
VADPQDVPSSQREFDALARAQLSDVAAAGRRIERVHRIRLDPRRRPHLRVVRTGAGQTRPSRGRRLPLQVQYLVVAAIVVAVVAISLAFPTKHDQPHSAPPAARPDVVVSSDLLFPARFTGADQTVYQRLTTSTSRTCGQGPGVPRALADAVARAGGCQAIQLALYTDARHTMRITVGVITTEEVAEMQAVNDAILHSGGAMMVGMLRPPPGVDLPAPADGALRPAYVTPTGSALVVGLGQWLATAGPSADTLRRCITDVMGAVTEALIEAQPVATISRPNR